VQGLNRLADGPDSGRFPASGPIARRAKLARRLGSLPNGRYPRRPAAFRARAPLAEGG
jgi:hypothetical protein